MFDVCVDALAPRGHLIIIGAMSQVRTRRCKARRSRRPGCDTGCQDCSRACYARAGTHVEERVCLAWQRTEVANLPCFLRNPDECAVRRRLGGAGVPRHRREAAVEERHAAGDRGLCAHHPPLLPLRASLYGCLVCGAACGNPPRILHRPLLPHFPPHPPPPPPPTPAPPAAPPAVAQGFFLLHYARDWGRHLKKLAGLLDARRLRVQVRACTPCCVGRCSPMADAWVVLGVLE